MKTCFVISPIGQDGSDIRKNSDDLFELVIEPALEAYNDFRVIRADMVASSDSITDDMIKKIQNSELCIIDLTGHNPNVFYECGRRHETAKPFILMKRKGESIPFDLMDIRTIDYDLSDPRKTRNSIENLRLFINEFEDTGYGSISSTASLTSIANALNRIERKIDTIGYTRPNEIDTNNEPLTGSPGLVFSEALANNDYATAAKALKRFILISPDINVNLDMATMLVEAYQPEGLPFVRSILEKDFDNLQPEKIAIALHGLYTYYVGALSIQSEYSYLSDMTKKALQRSNLTEKQLAAYYNILASLEYSMKNDVQSLKYQEKTVDLFPMEPAYQYNISTIYNELGMKDKLNESLNFIIAIYKNKNPQKDIINVRYLDYAKKYFAKNNQADKVNDIDEIISKAQKYPENISNTI